MMDFKVFSLIFGAFCGMVAWLFLHFTYPEDALLAIDCDGVEDEYAKTIRQRSALDYLVYNAPLEYAELVLCGDMEGYLKLHRN